ncbi:hypothetical protein Tco_0990705 [Tanacetum coccineum]|uniref:Uncharacterized protein n=1 Tax=Tanacetum coccineum TaxID=301880 RepID=A0ABQ5EX76_9ASTR
MQLKSGTKWLFMMKQVQHAMTEPSTWVNQDPSSTTRRELEPSLKHVREIDYDEDVLEEIFEYRYKMTEVPESEYDSNAMYMIKNWSEDKRIFYIYHKRFPVPKK